MNWTSGTKRRVLPNGLTLLAQRDAAAPVVAVVTHVKAGLFDEPDQWIGIAHVLEHMFFKGTARRGPGEIARDTQLLGGYLNAGTSYDKTVYYTVLPSSGDGLVRALDVQADALMHTALDADELARELEVIIQEAKRKLDTPPAVANEKLYALLFYTHRMRRWRIGTEEGLRKLTHADLEAYYTTRYSPNRVIVAIAGDIEVERALDLATGIYSGWERPATVVPGSPEETESVRPNILALNGDVTRPLAAVGWRTVGTLHQDAPALDIAAALLGWGRGSRLYRAVRMLGLASSTHAVHYTPTEVGVFDVSLECDAGKLEEAVERSVELVRDLGERGPDDGELLRVRALTVSRWARQFESMDGRGGILCECEAQGDYTLTDELYAKVIGVTAEDVRRVVTTHLHADRACTVLYLPEGQTSRLANGGWPVTLRDSKARLDPVSPPPHNAVRLPAGVSEEAVEHEGGVLHSAEPGMDLLVRPKRGAGLVTLVLHVPGVTGKESADDAGISRLFGRCSVRGAGCMGAEELAQAAESLGGGVTTGASVDGVSWSTTVKADALPAAAELLRVIALEPTLSADAIAVERTLQASDARRLRDDMYGYPVQQVLLEAFKGDAYGLPPLGEPGAIEQMSPDRVRDWSQVVASGRAVAVAVGDLDPDDLLSGLGPLAYWPAAAVEPAKVVAPAGFGSGRCSEERDKEQSALAMAFPAFRYSSPERHALVVTATLLSGLAGRLFRELRDKMSLAYTVAATPWLRSRAGAMIGYIATSPEREDEARDAMLRELRRLTEEPVTESELERARNYAAGLVEIRQQSGAAIAGEILTAWLNGVIDEMVELPSRLRAVSAEDVMRVAQRVFDQEARAEYVVRGGRR
jgi:zinc protease